MDPEIKSACIKAAARVGFGLSIAAALVGIRIVTATPDGVEAGIDRLEELEAEIAAEPSERAPVGDAEARGGDSDPAAEGSIVSRLGDGVRDRLSGSKAPDRGGDKLVSCRLAGRTHFMRAADCSMRGGASTVVEPDS